MEYIVNAAIVVLLSANVGVQMVDSVCDMQAASLCSETYVEKASSFSGSVQSMCIGITEMKECIGQATNSCDGRERRVIEDMLFHVIKIETAHCTKDKSNIRISGETEIVKDQTIHLVCRVTGKIRTPEYVEWFHDGVMISTFSNAKSSIRTRDFPEKTLQSELLIKEAHMSDAGTYVCRASDMQLAATTVQVISDSENTRLKNNERKGDEHYRTKDDEVAPTMVDSDCDLMAVVECSEKYATDIQKMSGPRDPAQANDIITVVCKATSEANVCLAKEAETCKDNLAFQELYTQLQTTYKSSCSSSCSPAQMMKCVEPLQKPPEEITDMCRVYKEYLTCYNDLIDSCSDEQKKLISETGGLSDLQSMMGQISEQCRDVADQDEYYVKNTDDKKDPGADASVVTPGKFLLLVTALLILAQAVVGGERQ